MFKRISCLFLIISIAFGAVSCAKKADTKPSENLTISEQSGEQTTSSQKEETSKSEKTTKNSKKKSAKKGDTTDKSTTAKNSVAKKEQKTAEKALPKKNASQKSTTKKAQSTTKKSVPATKKSNTITVSVSVDCTSAVGKVEGVPNYYLSSFEIDLEAGATAFSATKIACAKAGISVISTKTMYGEYISAIGSLAEKDTSRYSGWTYTVNGSYPPKAADKYTLENGDTIKWIYKA